MTKRIRAAVVKPAKTQTTVAKQWPCGCRVLIIGESEIGYSPSLTRNCGPDDPACGFFTWVHANQIPDNEPLAPHLKRLIELDRSSRSSD